MWQQLRSLFCKKEYSILFLSIAVVFFIALRSLPHWSLFTQFFALPDISWMRRWEVFYEYAILSIHGAMPYEQFISVALPLMIALNFVITLAYYKQRAMLFRGKSIFASGVGLFLGLFGIGCFACSGLLLAPILTMMGLSGAVAALPYRGLEIGVVGVVLLGGVSMVLLSQMGKGQVCHK